MREGGGRRGGGAHIVSLPSLLSFSHHLDHFFPPTMLRSFLQGAAAAPQMVLGAPPPRAALPLVSPAFWRQPWAISLASLGACVGLTWVPYVLYRRMYARRLGHQAWDTLEPRTNIFRAEDEEHSESVLSYMRRCLAAHANGLESFPVYAVAILLAIITRVEAKQVDKLACLYVLLRIFYDIFYIYGSNVVMAKMRTLSWIGNWAIILGLYLKSLRRIHLLQSRH